MNHYYEIQHSDGEVIQRVARITEREREILTDRHYIVVRVNLSLGVWPWLLGEEDPE